MTRSAPLLGGGPALALALVLILLPTRASALRAAEDAAPPTGIVRVTAGEHGAYSRVVLALGAGLAYRTELEPAGFLVVFPGARLVFEYDGVYPKRRAHRVIAAEAGRTGESASFRLRFGCDCEVETSVLDQKLVIDVFDAASGATEPPPPTTADATAERRAAVLKPPAPAAPALIATWRDSGALEPPPAAPPPAAGASDDRQPRQEFVQRIESLDEPAPHPVRAGRDAGGFDPERLERMLAWAIEHGHLTDAATSDPAVPSPPDGSQPAAHDVTRRAAFSNGTAPSSTAPSVASSGSTLPSTGPTAASSDTTAGSSAATALSSGASTTSSGASMALSGASATSNDRNSTSSGADRMSSGSTATPRGDAAASPGAPPARSTTTTAPAAANPGAANACPEGGGLDMAALDGRGSFAAEHARLQDALSRALAAERGIDAARRALAGFYVARLMPQEALAALGEPAGAATAGPERAWLEAAALVLADRPSAAASSVVRDAPCRSADAELWRAVVFAAEGPLPDGMLESEAILLRLAAYPADLRVELGLRLVEAGIDGKASAALERLMDLIEGAALGAEARARLLFLRGRLAAARGDFVSAEAAWNEAAGLGGEGGLRGTLALVEAQLERDAPDVAAALPRLERLAYDWRGHPLQLRIARLTAAVHERSGDLLAALGALEEIALGEAGRPAGRAATRLAVDLMRRAYAAPVAVPALDQMAAFWRYEGFVPPGAEDAQLRLAFARGLIDQGLPGPALGLLEPIARGATGPDADRAIDLLAEAHLGIHQPARALEVLRAAAPPPGAPRPERNQLAARALAALGRFAEAAGVLHGDTDGASARLQADYLWKAGLWSQAANAYRALLRDGGGQDQPVAVRQAALRLAAAAHMAGRPALAGEVAAAAAGDEVAATAFAALPAAASDRVTAPAAAARLLEQARRLGELAARYGVGEREAR